eukprot:GFYU01023731.1.p1 GENE.GFYU01023731.1~~GFYU01023731.1.p1  ORF type:complete len:117 (+),score=21.60 GFYU01023731.1:264-614(+)
MTVPPAHGAVSTLTNLSLLLDCTLTLYYKYTFFTRVASSHGKGRVNIINNKYRTAFDQPVDPQCECNVCRNYSAAYLSHLHRANEPVAATLGAIHNLHHTLELFRTLRQRIWNNEI